MSSTYSPSLRIELIGAGEQAGTWNTTTNTNLGTLIEDAIAGYVSVSVTSANQAFTALDGAPDQSRNAVIALTTTTTAAFAVYAPPQEKTYIIWNTTAYTATIYNSTVLGNTTAAGLGVAIPAGKKLLVFSTGTNFYTVEAANLTGVLAVANGGTGVTSSTGTGSVVLNTSPTFVTPVLGTPSSGNLSNCSFPTLNQNTTGNAATATKPASGGSFITSSNIGSQSVSFATNATNATTAANGGVTSVNGSTGAVTVNTLGVGQTWQDVSSSRVNGTTYQNTTGRSIMVSLGNSLTSNVQVSVDASTWVNVGREVGGSTYPNQFIVPNNVYYRTESFGGTRFWWSELR